MKSIFGIILLLLAAASAFSPSKSASRLSTQLFDESNQADYGIDKELPSTYVRCGNCQSHFAITPEDLGERGKGRRLQCGVCDHTWFQSKDRLLTLRPNMELVPMPEMELNRVAQNVKEDKPASFVGDSKLYVGNVAFECSETNLYEEFAAVGDVGDVSLVYDSESGRPRGFAFVTMRTKQDADKALEALNGKDVMGRAISVREANN